MIKITSDLPRQVNEALANFDAEALEPEVRHLRCTGYVDSDELNTALETYQRMPFSSERERCLLDIGCGQGKYGQAIASKVLCRHIGVDLSFEIIDLACKSQTISTPLSQGMLGICADLRRLPFRDGAINGIFAIDILHFVSERGVAASECYRVCANGAPIVATVCSPSSSDVATWSSVLLSTGYTTVSVEDSSPKWQAWLRRKHEARLDQQERLIELIGYANAAAVLSVSRQLLHGSAGVPRIDQMRRFLIKANK